MAALSVANLSITDIPQTKTARCTAKVKITFTSYEMEEMKQGLRFRLDCSLYGDDPVWDDHLFHYASKFFPDASPANPENPVFDAVLGTSLLDEDFGRDEIYAKFRLRNLYTGSLVTAKSNVVHRSF